MKHEIQNIKQSLKDFNSKLSLGYYDLHLRYLFLTVTFTFIGCGLWMIS